MEILCAVYRHRSKENEGLNFGPGRTSDKEKRIINYRKL